MMMCRLPVCLVCLFFSGVALGQQGSDKPADGSITIDLDAASETPPQVADDTGVQTPRRVTAEDILREFQKQRPKPKPLLPEKRREAIPGPSMSGTHAGSGSGAGMGDGRLRMPDGYFMVDRVGRLTQSGPWWVIHYVSDNNPDESPDPPMKLLPNRMLERMIREVEGSGMSVEFIVSGEVTEFMDENYLLLRKLMRRRDVGNLSR